MVRLPLAAAILACAVAPCLAQGEKSYSAVGQVIIGNHRVKFTADELYTLDVEASGFTPQVYIGERLHLSESGHQAGSNNHRFVFVPKNAATQRILILPLSQAVEEGGLPYKLYVNAWRPQGKAVLEKQDTVAKSDPELLPLAMPGKTCQVELTGGEVYLFDVKGPAKHVGLELLLLSPANKVIGTSFTDPDYDSHGRRDSRESRGRMVIQAPATGIYQIQIGAFRVEPAVDFQLQVQHLQKKAMPE